MSIHNIRCSVQLIKIAKRYKKSLKKHMMSMILADSVRVIGSSYVGPMPSIRNLHCELNTFVSPDTRSGQISRLVVVPIMENS